MPPESSLSDDLIALLEAEFGGSPRTLSLIEFSLANELYVRETALGLVSAAKGRSGESWSERCLALVFLENQLLRLPPSEIFEFDVILTHLGLKEDFGLELLLTESVLVEGFSTRDLRGFITELLRKLSRLNRVHEAVQRGDRGSWDYALRTVRNPAKLSLARYVFSANEVMDEVVKSLTVTEGTGDELSGQQHDPLRSNHENIAMPRFETAILNRLCACRKICWVSDRCSSELNSLVEYPLASAVLVIKPPGSDLEIEIKRAGTRGPRLLDVIARRNGANAPVSHRLFGGSLGWLAKRETAAAAAFSNIFRLVHGREAPCSRGVMNSSIVNVPTADGETHILDYLNDEHRFGTGFEATRAAMRDCIESFPSDTGVARASYSGEAGTTLQFIGQALPEQAIIVGSTSFRLDRIVLYLSESGPEQYFKAGFGRSCTPSDAQWLADSVLEEILGELTVPVQGYLGYSEYIRETFRVPENRRRADANYLSVMRQIGECWGTLLAVRGFSDGESFVLRNAGLKSIWTNGAWQIRIIFMDHDDLTVAGSRYQYLWPSREISGMRSDQVHILGGPMGDETIPGEVGTLQTIYRVDSDLSRAGVTALEEALVAAYRSTQDQISSNEDLRALFYSRFLVGYRDFDELMPGFLDSDPSQLDSWKTEAETHLVAKGYESQLIAEYIKVIPQARPFFERMRFLYFR
jgi:hypothetical protein